jgi:hypothetical protein
MNAQDLGLALGMIRKVLNSFRIRDGISGPGLGSSIVLGPVAKRGSAIRLAAASMVKSAVACAFAAICGHRLWTRMYI